MTHKGKYDNIMQFNGEYSWLSNMSTFTPFIIDGISYNSTENFYQSRKSENSGVRIKVSKLSPMQSKQYGKHIELRKDWEEVKVDVMKEGLSYKFAVPKMMNLLANTGVVRIVEGNTWGDKFWGVDIRTGVGKNTLGQLITEIRALIFEAIEKNEFLIDRFDGFNKLFDLYDFGRADKAVIKIVRNNFIMRYKNPVQIDMLCKEISKIDEANLEILTLENEMSRFVAASPALLELIHFVNIYMSNFNDRLIDVTKYAKLTQKDLLV